MMDKIKKISLLQTKKDPAGRTGEPFLTLQASTAKFFYGLP